MRGAARARGGRAARAAGVLAVLALWGCRQDMHDQPRYKPLARSEFFADGRSARPAVAGSVARGELQEDARYYTGKQAGAFVETLPVPVDLALLKRGRERYDIFCAPCHGRSGAGDGMIVQRGFRRPPSLHIERLRREKPGYLYDVIANGFGAMPDYGAQLPVADRWAVVAYLRALQLSQHASLADLPAAERARLEAGPPASPAGGGGHGAPAAAGPQGERH